MTFLAKSVQHEIVADLIELLKRLRGDHDQRCRYHTQEQTDGKDAFARSCSCGRVFEDGKVAHGRLSHDNLDATVTRFRDIVRCRYKGVVGAMGGGGDDGRGNTSIL